jgi:eukaryotic-like serine/threonine-protein kinase
MHDRIITELSGKYRIDHEIGRGANAIVYQAYDVKHDRYVALKALLPDLAQTIPKDRFITEVRVAAKLTHPHILPLYDSGEIAGTLYYVTPLVPGETLRACLEREKQLPLERALSIARDVAIALDFAHTQGVVHRDIKPENILLHDGVAIVADFGIARALSAEVARITQTGLAVGTPAYMSPEQAGGGALDGRSDIYSLGCVCYEMLAGHTPFTGTSVHEILSRHALDPVPRISPARPDLPRSIESGLERALAKSPADRFATAAAFVKALSARATPRPKLQYAGLIAIVAASAALAAVVARRSGVPAQGAPGEAPSVLVLPFVNVSSDRNDEYFSDGMTDEVIAALSRVPNIEVVDRSTSFHFKDRNLPLRVLADSTHATTALEASVRRVASHLRVSVALLRMSDGKRLWSEVYDHELRNADDVMRIQEAIARAIAGKLSGKPTENAPALTRSSPQDLAAYDWYLRGRYYWARRSKDNILKAIEYFDSAIAHEPAYALAHSGLADAYFFAGFFNYLPRTTAYEKARTAALQAIAYDSTIAEAHTSLGRVDETVQWDFAAAQRAYRKAISLDPDYATAHAWYANLLSGLRRNDEAIREANLAVRLEPFLSGNNVAASIAYRGAGRWAEAIMFGRRAVELAPEWAGGHASLGQTYSMAGRFADAAGEYAEQARLLRAEGGRTSNPMSYVACDAVRQGNPDVALGTLREFTKDPATPGILVARVFDCLGDRDGAFAAFRKVAAARGTPLYIFNSSQVFATLHSDPRYIELMMKLGVPESALR